MNTQELINQLKDQYQQAINYGRSELLQIKTGKASPSLIETIIVETYDKTTKLMLKEVASISIKDVNTLAVSPFDPATIIDTEKAIQSSPLNLSSRLENNVIYVTIPPLTEEQRDNFIKIISKIIESAKNKIRQHRDETRKAIKSQFENKNITQDDKYRFEKQIDEITKEFNDQLEELKLKKIQDLKTI